MANSIATKPRSLAKLAPMIRKELKAGFQAGERHWQTAGRLLNEAKKHWSQAVPRVNGITFHEWVAKNFEHPMNPGTPLPKGTATRWMAGARNGSTRRASTLKGLTDKRSPHHEDHNPKLDWQASVRKVQQKINVEQLEKRWEDEDREIREQMKLAKQIVEAGYKALSAVVHPDRKGGSREAMAKLTTARKWLEEQIRRNS